MGSRNAFQEHTPGPGTERSLVSLVPRYDAQCRHFDVIPPKDGKKIQKASSHSPPSAHYLACNQFKKTPAFCLHIGAPYNDSPWDRLTGPWFGIGHHSPTATIDICVQCSAWQSCMAERTVLRCQLPALSLKQCRSAPARANDCTLCLTPSSSTSTRHFLQFLMHAV